MKVSNNIALIREFMALKGTQQFNGFHSWLPQGLIIRSVTAHILHEYNYVGFGDTEKSAPWYIVEVYNFITIIDIITISYAH